MGEVTPFFSLGLHSRGRRIYDGKHIKCEMVSALGLLICKIRMIMARMSQGESEDNVS